LEMLKAERRMERLWEQVQLVFGMVVGYMLCLGFVVPLLEELIF
jgi:hypothetical protein